MEIDFVTGQSYHCWYDSNNHEVALWSLTKAKTPIILMGIFFPLAGVLIIALIVEMVLRKNRREGVEYDAFAHEEH